MINFSWIQKKGKENRRQLSTKEESRRAREEAERERERKRVPWSDNISSYEIIKANAHNAEQWSPKLDEIDRYNIIKVTNVHLIAIVKSLK